jgi:two-component system chemotaxis response regulator CheB
VTKGRDIIVVGASAGGVEALCQLVRGLPPGLPAAVFVVCHFPTDGKSLLPEILSRHGQLLARHPSDGEPIYPGQIYVAPPDYHLFLEPAAVRLSHGPRENRFRPSIDPLFRSAARVFGPRVVAVMLSGALSDGVAGLLAVRAAGGVAVVQDPADAILPSLPQSASDIAGADHVVPVGRLARLLADLVHPDGAAADNPSKPPPAPAAGGKAMFDPVEKITQTAAEDLEAQARDARRGTVSTFTCPECGGCMWQLDEAELLRFRCHVGHAYGADALLAEQSAALEAALWTAVRTFREKGVLARQLANRDRQAGNAQSAGRFEEEGQLAERYGGLIQEYLLRGLNDPQAAPAGEGADIRAADDPQASPRPEPPSK